jgi:hypothetical protein
VNVFVDFISRERRLYDGDDNNRVSFALAQPARYLQYLEFILPHHAELCAQQMAAFRKLTAEPSGTRELSQEEVEEIHRQAECQSRILMDSEAFYLFGTIFMDRVACFIEHYFGRPKVGRIDSHRKLKNKLADYADEKGLTLPEGLSDSAQWLEANLCEHRDREITHDKSSRSLRFLSFSGDGGMHASKSKLYPAESDEQVDALPLPDLKARIDRYVGELISLIEANRARTCYRLRAEPRVARSPQSVHE